MQTNLKVTGLTKYIPVLAIAAWVLVLGLGWCAWHSH